MKGLTSRQCHSFLTPFPAGLIVARALRMCGFVGLVVNILCYGGLWYLSEATHLLAGSDFLNNFLNWMAISFVLCMLVMGVMTALAPRNEPFEFAAKTELNLESSKGAFAAGIVCILLTLALYVVFSPLGIAK